MAGRLLQLALRSLDAVAAELPWNKREPGSKHLRTGRKGEDDAYFWLRRQGYVMVARNWRSPRRKGEVDLIGWDDGVLCFIEVKTRRGRGVVTAEAAIDHHKQHELRAVAREYLRRLDPLPGYRFDVVAIYYEPTGASTITLWRNAFPIRG
jgi:putative endonuclease